MRNPHHSTAKRGEHGFTLHETPPPGAAQTCHMAASPAHPPYAQRRGHQLIHIAHTTLTTLCYYCVTILRAQQSSLSKTEETQLTSYLSFPKKSLCCFLNSLQHHHRAFLSAGNQTCRKVHCSLSFAALFSIPMIICSFRSLLSTKLTV